jgi:glucose-1-phosphate cytidylyltransferase
MSIKTVILAGGRGSRLSEETTVRPKPMVEIGDVPILVHILRIYAASGFNDFVIALGYRGDIIKDFFVNYRMRNSDLTVELATGAIRFAGPPVDDWTVRLVDTGQDTLTGGRLLRLRGLLERDGTFMLTYGDGVADIDVAALLAFHRKHGKLATVTAVRPPGRFGVMALDAGNRVTAFSEKPQAGEGWINGGFFVFEPGVFRYLEDGDVTVLEGAPLERLAAGGELMAFRHDGFWHPMDTVRDRAALHELCRSGRAPWQRPSAASPVIPT